ncbi:hypothetical protein CHS0354_028710 [Potamilus streckersoni]|uniref:Uncharacterized protein n=1 Tax=Potamilus streckersoni TaxID=2493646 RepID=A0AAE0W3W1_9BIVA|nr:hypothetical protein CHS0354_028710 [Potamilus streckersoni]
MAVKSLKTGGLVVCCFLTLFANVSLSNANKYNLRKGETGRYMYDSESQESGWYCRYCPKIPMLFESEDVNRKYLVGSCVIKNSPFKDKLDQEEITNQRYPVCHEGEIPSCALPQNPVGGFWKCEEPENPEKVPVYKTCQLHCDSGYKKVGEGNIYCNESRKFDPPLTETTCINELESTEGPLQAHYTSMGFHFLAICLSIAVVVLICVLVTIVYCCRKYPQQFEIAFSRIKRGFKKPKSTVVSSPIPESIVILEKIDDGQLTSLKDTQMPNTNIYIDPSKEALLPKEPNRIRIAKDPIENEDQISYPGGNDDTLECITNEIEINKARIKVFSDSQASLDTSKYDFMTLNPTSIDNQRNVGRSSPEGDSCSTTGWNEPSIYPPQGLDSAAYQNDKSDVQETFSKEFMRDPKFCAKKAHRDLILEWEKLGANGYCDDIVKVVEEMEALGSGHRSSHCERRAHVYELMRNKDLRIGEIVYFILENQRQDHANILHQIQQVHPDCNFCKSLYDDMANNLVSV